MHPVEEYQDITLTMDGLNECEIVTLAERRVDVKLLYNPGEDRKSVSWRSGQLEIRCGRENQHPAEVGPQAPDWAVAVGVKMVEWRTCPREAGPPSPQLSSPGERERNAVMAIRVGINMLQFCSVSNSLSLTTLSIKWEVDFSRELCR